MALASTVGLARRRPWTPTRPGDSVYVVGRERKATPRQEEERCALIFPVCRRKLGGTRVAPERGRIPRRCPRKEARAMKFVVLSSAVVLVLAMPAVAAAQSAPAAPSSCPPGSWFCPPAPDAQPLPAGKPVQGLQPLPDPEDDSAPAPRPRQPSVTYEPAPPPVVVYQPPAPVMIERPEGPPPYE